MHLQIYANITRVISIYFEYRWTKNFKRDTSLRKAISASERLYLTIHYLAYGNSQHDLSFTYRIGRSTVLMIIRETCKALWDSLSVQYYRSPQNKGQMAKDFEEI